jgi:hypothetical protein
MDISMSDKDVLSGVFDERSLSNTAVLIGNGINMASGIGKSWSDILTDLASRLAGSSEAISIKQFKELIREHIGISYPEIYDLISMMALKKTGTHNINIRIKETLCKILRYWFPSELHVLFVRYCNQKRLPILTTNYDLTLERASIASHCKSLQDSDSDKTSIKFFHNKNSTLDSDTFLWNRYFSDMRHDDNINQYAIYHVHGYVKKPSSIRIGFNDYVELLTRLKRYQLSAFYDNLERKALEYEQSYSWIDYFYTSNLIILGLGLGQSEADLRWLLMDRWRYCLLSGTKLNTKFVYGRNTDKGTLELLKGIGVDCISDSDHEIYKTFADSEEHITCLEN